MATLTHSLPPLPYAYDVSREPSQTTAVLSHSKCQSHSMGEKKRKRKTNHVTLNPILIGSGTYHLQADHATASPEASPNLHQ